MKKKRLPKVILVMELLSITVSEVMLPKTVHISGILSFARHFHSPPLRLLSELELVKIRSFLFPIMNAFVNANITSEIS